MHGEIKRYWLANYRKHLNGEWQRLDLKTNTWKEITDSRAVPDLLWPIETSDQIPWTYYTDRSQETDVNGFWIN